MANPSTRAFSVKGIAHTGLTVRSLQGSLDFWHVLLNMPILYKNTLRGPVVEKIVGVPACHIDTALLQLPNGTQLELLEYHAPEDKTEFQPRPCDVGNVHVALTVTGLDELVERAKGLGWRVLGEVQKLKRGDGSIWRMGYIGSEDGVTVELLEELGED